MRNLGRRTRSGPRRRCAGWGFRLALFALLVQCAAAALPMPAAAGVTGLPGWLESSLCQGSGPEAPAHAPATPPEAPAHAPATPMHLICPVCFVQSAAGSAVPPQPPVLMAIMPWRVAIPPAPAELTLPRQHAAFVAQSRAPPVA